MTPFSAALSMCALSQSEAATFLGLSEATIASRCTGRRSTPDSDWRKLADRFDVIRHASGVSVFIGRYKSPLTEAEDSGVAYVAEALRLLVYWRPTS